MAIVPPPLHPQNGTPPLWAARFWAKADLLDTGCWEWNAGKHNGYGTFNKSGWGTARAHRISYLWANGSISEGLVLDHLCRNRGCINPAHLEPVTQRENLLRGETFQGRNARKTHCLRGHELAGDNLLPSNLKRGWRMCRTCHNLRAREYDRKKRGAAKARKVATP